MGNKAGAQSQSEEEADVVPSARVPPLTALPGSASSTNRSLSVENGEEGELDMELPPPMKVLEQPMSAAAAQGGPGATTASTGPPIPPLDDILTEVPSREQHTETSERLNEWRSSGDGCSGDEASSPVPSQGAMLTPQLSDDTELGASALPRSSHHRDSSPGDCDLTRKQRELQKRQFVVAELIETERLYVSDLEAVVEGYIKELRNPDSEMKMPEDLKDGKDKMVFGNIEAIYEWHRDFFMKNLESCIDNPREIGAVFQRSEKRLQIYVKYCQNKPTSEYIVAEFSYFFEELRQKLGHKLQLPDLLIKPVQRLMKYQLLLRDIHKYTERAGLLSEADCIKKALTIMTFVPKAADDMMNVGRLQGFDGKIMAQGKLLMHRMLTTSEGASGINFRGKDLMVFLFEQSIIFSECGRRKNQFANPIYQYKSHLQVNKMALVEEMDDGDPLKFTLKSTDARKPNLAFTCQGSCEEDRNEWVSQIFHLLQTQKDFLKAIQSPIAYQKEQTKNVTEPGHHHPHHPHPCAGLHKSHSQPSTHRLAFTKKKANTIDIPSSHSMTNSHGTSMLSSALAQHRPPPPPPAPPAPTTSRLPVPIRKETSVDKFDSPSSPPKAKKKIFDGFRNTLRTKVKAEGAGRGTEDSVEEPDPLLSSPRHDSKEDSFPRRWSESGSPVKAGEWNVPLPTGTMVKVLADFTSLREDEISVTRGEVIQIISSNLLRGYLVHRAATSSSPAAEGWVPASVLLPSAHPDLVSTPPASPTNLHHGHDDPHSKKPWIKFRKPSFSKKDQQQALLRREETLPELPSVRSSPHPPPPPTRQMTVSLINPYHSDNNKNGESQFNASRGLPASPDSPVRIVGALHNVTVCPGEPVEMVCVIAGAGLWLESTTVSWVGPHGPLTDPRFEIEQHRDGTLRLHVGSCRVSDAGEYTCTISCAGHSIACSARINLAQDAAVEEEEETKEMGDEGTVAKVGEEDDSEHEGEHDEGDEAGEERLLTVRWCSGFQHKYSVMQDLGRGRFSVVKRCRRERDGREVVAKFVRRGRQERAATQAEFCLLRRLRHPSLIRPIALYTATPKFDILVLELVMGLSLLDWVFTKEETTEAECAQLVVQVINALQYLHSRHVVYLDLKPENILVDILRTANKNGRCEITTDDALPAVRLVDFGSARTLSKASHESPDNVTLLTISSQEPPVLLGSPEFMAPELIARRPVGVPADYWSVGVLIYVLVSGRSPFLGTSLEGTCKNILSADLSYPVEHFAAVTQEACDLTRDLLTQRPEDRPKLEDVVTHPWFNMGACESVLPIQSLADFSFRRSKVASSVQEIALPTTTTDALQ